MSFFRGAVRLCLPLACLTGLLAAPTAVEAVGPNLPVSVPTPSLPVSLPAPSLPVQLPNLPVATPTPSLPALPPLPIATPSLPPLPIATPSPSLPPLPIATPSPSLPPLPILGPTPSPSPTPINPGGGGGGGGSQLPPPGPGASPSPSAAPVLLQTRPVGGHGSGQAPSGGGGQGATQPRGMVLIPAITLPPGPLGVALAVAIAALPLMLAMGLLLLGRIWGEARRLRSARLRMALAAELDLKPRELAQLSPQGLLKLRDQVAFDELTGVLRRAAGVASVEREIARARRAHTPLVAAFIDVDGLKRVNDSRGHAAGDQLLRGVADLLGTGLRKQDLVFRYGGDEFVCVLPGIDLEVAEGKLRDLRARAAERSLNFSFGAAALQDDDDLVSFMGRADQLLYDSRARRDAEVTKAAPVIPIKAPDARGSGRRHPRSAT